MLSIQPDIIEIGKRHRSLDDDAVQRLASSMKEIGLRSPITVRVVNDYISEDGEISDGVPLLVSGAHRLAAAKALGWEHIDCIDAGDDAISAELWELAENLHRLDLTKEQRDEHLCRYAELIIAQREAEKPDTVSDFKSAGAGRGNKGVAAEIAENTGISQRTVRRALNPIVRVPDPPLDPEDAYNRWAGQMNRLWGNASQECRERWEDERDGPAFDNARTGG